MQFQRHVPALNTDEWKEFRNRINEFKPSDEMTTALNTMRELKQNEAET